MNVQNFTRPCYALLRPGAFRLRLCLLLIFFTFSLSHGQQIGRIWYFGNSAGLDFNSGSPIALTNSAMNTIEGCATLTGPDGALMFYTNGETVWNKNHQDMVNGSGLFGQQSAVQSAVIVPKPGSNTIFYIFTVDAPGWSGVPSKGCNYSEVDMSLDGGLGAVTVNKNIAVVTASTEQLAMVKHSNGIDFWVITHGFPGNSVHAVLVTASGVNTTPVVSSLGMNLTSLYDLLGCIKVSPAGNKLALGHHGSGMQLMDFNTTTGVASNDQTILSSFMVYGVEFSPSGKRLYVSYTQNADLFQYNLDAADIPASAVALYSADIEENYGGLLQRGPDNKVYFCMRNRSALSVINNPDALGIACGFQYDTVSLGGKISESGLPTPTQVEQDLAIQVVNFCHGDTTVFSVIPAITPDTIVWDFNDGSFSNELSPSHVYAATGTYNVSATIQIQGETKIIFKTIVILETPTATKPPDMTACGDENGQAVFDLKTQRATILGPLQLIDFTVGFYTSIEDARAGINFIPEQYTNISNPQTIYARVSPDAGICHAITSFQLNVVSKPVITMPNAFAFCQNSSVTITAPAGFSSYLWSTGATSQAIVVSKAGSYTVTVYEVTGGTTCEATKTITVTESLKPKITHIEVNDWTDNNNSIVITVSGGGNYEYSIDGINYQASSVFTKLLPGKYTVYVKDMNDCGTDKQEVVLLMYPRFFTPNGDGVNELWTIKYAFFEPNIKVHIFDRYGKLVHSFKGSEPGWNGELNGYRLPSTDYWFVVYRGNGKEYKGHFSLMR
ncbi:T9SS type B sorting domain-containing protein [Flavobacterium cerinum]|uniref:T9SS type B sorting domain-containing protein n=1 Tax=Flavobacterium cerinum TaxID=2502784 RepID=A0A444H903_9FLAO|nr:T9SS type B sorting domain-containing protein [Flavobacterium cerinum]RWW99645.1 T9SS type B sorting domain-containing protein [Flavobacterium cerinum]